MKVLTAILERLLKHAELYCLKAEEARMLNVLAKVIPELNDVQSAMIRERITELIETSSMPII